MRRLPQFYLAAAVLGIACALLVTRPAPPPPGPPPEPPVAPYRPAPPAAPPVPAAATPAERLALAHTFRRHAGEARPGLLGGYDLVIVPAPHWTAGALAGLSAFGTLAVAEVSATRVLPADPLYREIPDGLRTRAVGPEARLEMAPEETWFSLLAARRLLPALDRGFDGLCLADLDLSGRPGPEVEATRRLLERLRAERPGRPLLLLGNAETAALLAPLLDGLVMVGLRHAALRDAGLVDRVTRVAPRLFSIEYADLQRADLVAAAYRFARDRGFAVAVQPDDVNLATSALLPPDSGRGFLAVAAAPGAVTREPADPAESLATVPGFVLLRDLPAGRAKVGVAGRTLAVDILPGRTTILAPGAAR